MISLPHLCRREKVVSILFGEWNPSQLRHGVSPVSNRTSEENGDDGKQSQETSQGELEFGSVSSLQEKYADYQQCDDEAGDKYKDRNSHGAFSRFCKGEKTGVKRRCVYFSSLTASRNSRGE